MSRVGAGLSLAKRDLIPAAPGEIVEPAADGAEFVAVLVVVLLLPARADAQDQPPGRDVVDGAAISGQQVPGCGRSCRVTSAPICTREVCSAQAPSIVQHS